ncbi:hypothetical protein FRACYDRAFT_247956 [Fragilariopsis cylindrus CCMP1102]|uniref:Uncharacterized protein n=1 Tax=Fragilariopsis cylindrus CCMP1102 TaxID=635003 RepID=A0A1E7EV15_9STRA|nr:hypothetical protein FRACYDRAFT_247956 [Fragilariopsis cylindrus CCMP1102]|eukprot:OEU09699.1 hypothetical protein FRACYDRAFT_247956 [Fragilariopsis cylindrus CCMP1102]
MSDILLDFVDRLVGDNDEETTIPPTTTSWLSAINDNSTTSFDFGQLDVEEDNNEYCTISSELFDNKFRAREFLNTDIIEWMHQFPPRFSNTNDILALLIGTNQEQKEYVNGLLSSSIVLFFFFVSWSTLLLIFRFCAPTDGTNSIRWLGGQPLRMVSPPLGGNGNNNESNGSGSKEEEGGGANDSTNTNTTIKKTNANTKTHFTSEEELRTNKDYQEWKRDYRKTKLQLSIFRIVAWFAGGSIVISALIMSVYGVDSLTTTLEAGRASIDITRNLAYEAQLIVDKVIQQNTLLSTQVYTLLEDINSICPLVRDPLCDDVYDISTCDVSSFLGTEINDVLQTVGTHFGDGDQSEIYQEIINAKNALEDVQSMSNEIDSKSLQLNWVLSMSMVFSLLLALLCILILLGLLCSPELPKIILFLQSKLMIPLFGVLVFFAYLFSTLFIIASIVTADVCVYTSPTDNIDERIMTLLERTSLKQILGPIVIEFISFYIHQCPIDNLPSDIQEQIMYVEAGIPLIGQFSTIVTENQTLEIIQDICGFQTNQTDSLIDVIDTIQYQLCDVATILEDIRQFMQCSNWYPLYETTVYETVCYDGTKGFAYVATTQFIIVLCSFLILTFRVAFWDIQIGDIYYNFIDENENENKNKTENQNENENETEKKDDHDNNNNNNNSNNNEDGGFEVGYYKGIRDRVTSSSKNCKQVGPVSSSSGDQQQQQPPTSLFNLLRFQSSFFDFDDSNATAITSAPTSSFEEPVATAAATSATADNDHLLPSS